MASPAQSGLNRSTPPFPLLTGNAAKTLARILVPRDPNKEGAA